MVIEEEIFKNTESFLAVMLLIAGRSFGLTFGFISWQSYLNISAKIAYSFAAFCFSLSSFSLVKLSHYSINLESREFYLYLIANIIIGSIISLVPLIFLEIFKHFAVLFDGLRGSRIAEYFETSSSSNISSLEKFLSLLGIVMFFLSGLHLFCFSLLRKSYEVVSLNIEYENLNISKVLNILDIRQIFFPLDQALSFIFVFLIFFLVFEFGLLLISHLLRGLPSFFEFMAFRLIIALVALFIFGVGFQENISFEIENFLESLEQKFDIGK